VCSRSEMRLPARTSQRPVLRRIARQCLLLSRCLLPFFTAIQWYMHAHRMGVRGCGQGRAKMGLARGLRPVPLYTRVSRGLFRRAVDGDLLPGFFVSLVNKMEEFHNCLFLACSSCPVSNVNRRCE
jgi:hypothetical protein